MATTASPPASARARLGLRVDLRAAWIWLLTLALVLYLGIDGGGYDLIVRSNAGIVVWWALLLAALLGLLPAKASSRAGRLAVAAFLLFGAWSTASALWSLSSERSLNEASRLAAYLGVLWLAAATFGDRRQALRHVAGAVCTGIVAIAGLAVLARLDPHLIPAAAKTGTLLGGSRSRLSWPLNYWNALGALMAFGLPLLLSVATSPRAVWARAVAAAAVPLVILCAYLTFSRGAAIAGGAALVVFVLASPQRVMRIATGLLGAAGGVILIIGSIHRHAVENGLATSQATSQGRSLLIWVIVVCIAVGLVQALATVALARAVPSRALTVPLRAALAGTVLLVVALIVAGLALHVPHHLDHAWQEFKRGETAGSALHGNTLSRFTALSGEGRYTFWKTGIDALGGHWLKGFGVGTFQLIWLPRAPFYSYIINAHSLYVETLVEVGVVGLLLLLAFLVTVLVSAVRGLRGVDIDTRGYAAGALAAIVAFVISAAFDWIWQVPVNPVCFLLVAAAVLAPRSLTAAGAPASDPAPAPRRRLARLAPRAATIVIALGCLLLMAVPMAMTAALRRSQAEANAGHVTAALADAHTALNIEPASDSSALQVALVLELDRRYAAAVGYARRATANDPDNWDAWLVRSRMEAEAGNAAQAVAAYVRARSLNPRSPLFHTSSARATSSIRHSAARSQRR